MCVSHMCLVLTEVRRGLLSPLQLELEMMCVIMQMQATELRFTVRAETSKPVVLNPIGHNPFGEPLSPKTYLHYDLGQ